MGLIGHYTNHHHHGIIQTQFVGLDALHPVEVQNQERVKRRWLGGMKSRRKDIWEEMTESCGREQEQKKGVMI